MQLFARARNVLMPFLVVSLCQAGAPQWREVLKEKDKVVSIQVGSVHRTRRGVVAWLKCRFVTPIEVQPSNAKVTLLVEKAEFSHDHKWTLRILMYDADGQQVVDHTNPADIPGIELVPETGEALIADTAWGMLPNAKTNPRPMGR